MNYQTEWVKETAEKLDEFDRQRNKVDEAVELIMDVISWPDSLKAKWSYHIARRAIEKLCRNESLLIREELVAAFRRASEGIK